MTSGMHAKTPYRSVGIRRYLDALRSEARDDSGRRDKQCSASHSWSCCEAMEQMEAEYCLPDAMLADLQEWQALEPFTMELNFTQSLLIQHLAFLDLSPGFPKVFSTWTHFP